MIQSCIRKKDILSRNGGEEFTVLLPDCPLDQAAAISEAVRMSVEKHPFILADHLPLHITVSVGLAVYPDTTANSEVLIDAADKALYNAKQNGRNQVWQAGHEKTTVRS